MNTWLSIFKNKTANWQNIKQRHLSQLDSSIFDTGTQITLMLLTGISITLF